MLIVLFLPLDPNGDEKISQILKNKNFNNWKKVFLSSCLNGMVYYIYDKS
jgi:hypothetical protein